MTLDEIQKVWGTYDVVLPEKWWDVGCSENAAGYYLYTDKVGRRYYYMIHELPLKECNVTTKGSMFVVNAQEYYVDKKNPEYYDLDAFAKSYVNNHGRLIFPLGIEESEGMERMYQYFDVTEDEFMKFVRKYYNSHL